MPKESRPVLATNRRDVAAAVARVAASGVPVVGGVIAEVVDSLIPGQKLDRVVHFIELLAEEVELSRERQSVLEERLRTPEGSDLLEEGIVQASRSVAEERRRRLARLILNTVTDGDLHYDRAKKLLAVFDSLTDSEMVLLRYYSQLVTNDSPFHKALRARYPDLLRPVSRELGAPQSEKDRGALRQVYEAGLVQHGLLYRHDSGSLLIGGPGRLLLKYLDLVEGQDEGAS